MTAGLSDWVAALSLGIAITAAAALPVLLWADADYLLVADWQPVRDRLLVETTNARHALREVRRRAAVTAAGLLLLLSTPATEVNR